MRRAGFGETEDGLGESNRGFGRAERELRLAGGGDGYA